MVLTSKDLDKFRNGGAGDGEAQEDRDDHDDNSSISGGSSGKTGSGGSVPGGGGAQGETSGVLSAHHTESKLVNCSKSVVYIILFLAAVSVSAACYFRLVKEEEFTMTTEVRPSFHYV